MNWHEPCTRCPTCDTTIASRQLSNHQGSQRCRANVRRKRRDFAARHTCTVNTCPKKYQFSPCGKPAVTTASGKGLCRRHAKQKLKELEALVAEIKEDLGPLGA